MINKEIKEKLNKIAEELFHDLRLDFNSHHSQMNIFTGYIDIASSVSIDKSEIIYTGIFNESKLKNLLKKRVKRALLELKDLIQDSLNKLEKL